MHAAINAKAPNIIKILSGCNSKIREKTPGNRATIPAKIIIELPFPTPNKDICSPSHMVKIEPTVKDNVNNKLKPMPGFNINPGLVAFALFRYVAYAKL